LKHFSFWYYWLQALKPSAPQPTAASDHDEHEKDRHQAEGKCREHCDYSASRNQGTLGLIDWNTHPRLSNAQSRPGFPPEMHVPPPQRHFFPTIDPCGEYRPSYRKSAKL